MEPSITNQDTFAHTAHPTLVDHAMQNIGRDYTRRSIASIPIPVKEEPDEDDEAEADTVPPHALFSQARSHLSVPSRVNELPFECDPASQRALMAKRKKVAKANLSVTLDTRHGYYRAVKCSPVVVDEVTMPPFPCISQFKDLIFFGRSWR